MHVARKVVPTEVEEPELDYPSWVPQVTGPMKPVTGYLSWYVELQSFRPALKEETSANKSKWCKKELAPRGPAPRGPFGRTDRG